MTAKMRATAILFAALALLLGLTACESSGGNGSNITEENLVENMNAALDDFSNLTSFELGMDLTVSIEGTQEGKDISSDVTAVVDMGVDIPNQNMKMSMHMDIPEDESNPDTPSEIDLQMYVVDDMVYTNMLQLLGMGDQWIKTKADESDTDMSHIWDSGNPVESETDLLTKAGSFEIAGTSKVNGVDCYEVRITPDPDQALELLNSEDINQYLPEGVDLSDTEQVADVLGHLSATIWVARDTLLPMKTKMHMSVADPETDTDATIDMEINMSYENMNEPISFDLPPEARNAPDAPDMMTDMMSGWFSGTPDASEGN